MIGIVARLPHALLAEINARFQTSDGSAIMLILELVLLFLVFMATVALVQAVRKIPFSMRSVLSETNSTEVYASTSP